MGQCDVPKRLGEKGPAVKAGNYSPGNTAGLEAGAFDGVFEQTQDPAGPGAPGYAAGHLVFRDAKAASCL